MIPPITVASTSISKNKRFFHFFFTTFFIFDRLFCSFFVVFFYSTVPTYFNT